MNEEINYQDYHQAIHFDQMVESMGTVKKLTQSLIKELSPSQNDKVLDVGTGTGRLGILLNNIISEGTIIGIDSGYGMLKLASEKIEKNNIKNFSVVLGKADKLPFPSESFDSVCLMLSFHHFTDPEGSVKEIHRVLKPNGYLVSVDPVLKDPVDDDEKKINNLIEEAFQNSHGPDFRFFSEEELINLYQRLGMIIKKRQPFKYSYKQEGTDGIPMAAHWFDAYELLWRREGEKLMGKFEDNYFAFREWKGKLMAKGEMTWVMIKAAKP
ncbi:MAG: methyltransferase domain-containing protein [Spirochaetota bacterium]|nr:methyltransferase domain-containing protein [Spirochaetota bacterium]